MRFDVKRINPVKYNWNENQKIFSTDEDFIEVDFRYSQKENLTIIVGDNCIVNCPSNCEIRTGNKCKIYSSSYCCIVSKDDCLINCGQKCNIITGNNSVINSANDCFVTMNNNCKIWTNYNSEIISGNNCKIMRRDIFDEIYPLPGKRIKLKQSNVLGYYNEEEILIKNIIE